jgi:formate/nitrite transporter
MPLKSPPEIASAICKVGVEKSKLPLGKMFVLGMLAGVYIGFGCQLMITVTQDLASISLGLSQLLGGAVFSVGLMLVVIAGAELFTGNCLMTIPLCSGEIDWRGLTGNWIIVYISNFIRSVLLASIVFLSGLYSMGNYAVGVRAISIANMKVNLPFIQALMRGIGCNWLVCLAVWLANSSDTVTGKILSCIFPIMAFVAIGFEHSVANMYFIPMGIFLKGVPEIMARVREPITNLTWEGFLCNNLLPVTIGNIIGGGFFVGMLYWYAYLRK